MTIEPRADARKRWTLRGEGTLIGLFQVVIPEESSLWYGVPNATADFVLGGTVRRVRSPVQAEESPHLAQHVEEPLELRGP